MKKIQLIYLLLLGALSIQAQDYDKNCYYGITFEMSKNPNWGYGELVITAVEPNSPAEKSGIKVNDIIMEVNGKATYLRDNQTIANFLFGNFDPITKFTIRNMDTYFKEYSLAKKCISQNVVSEQQLSSIFSFYNLENTSEYGFTLPIHVDTNQEVEFTDYHTYDFYRDAKDAPEIDKHITDLLERSLQAKGLVRNTEDPDIIIQAYYSYGPNPQYTGLYNNVDDVSQMYIYDSDKGKMVLLPIFDESKVKANMKGQFVVEYGFSFYDKKYINKSQMTQIWDCSTKNYLSTKYSLEEYVRIHTPLMLMQFPYTSTKTEAEYTVNFNKYNYTGIYFDASDLKTVKDIDENSPAYKAGIRPGYIIRKVNNISFDHTKESLSVGYKNFISETMFYRDQSTRFTDINGFTDCMYWNKAYLHDIQRSFSNPAYQTHFSYLYNFSDFVNSKSDKTLRIEAWDGKQSRIFNITPEIRQSTVVKAL